MNIFWKKYYDNLEVNSQKVAIIEAEGGRSITFGELECESEKIANYIVNNNDKFGKYVGVSSQKSINSIVTIIGIMKTGRAYIPLDDNMPEDRRRYILEQCDDCFCSYKEIDENVIERTDRNATDTIGIDINESAYVIYTSGSTGVPKGVEISYRSVINTIDSVNTKFGVNDLDVLINLAPFDFDLSVYDIFNTITTGSSLVIVRNVRNLELIINAITDNGVTVWNSVPMVMEMLLTYFRLKYPEKKIESLNKIFLSGDKTYARLADEMRTVFPNSKIVSMGGATECAIWSNYYIYNGYEENNEEIIPYGYSLDNQKLIIVDENMAECEVDTPGEIAIAGCGVAKGYYRDPIKTKKSFVDTEKWGRVYKTGDKGVLTSAGYINFLGRLDRQKKIRGYRVELEEIENVLEEITGRRCAVGVVNDCIIAKVVYTKGIDSKYIEEKLKVRLPHYMIPGKIDFVDYIPETKNGKVDYSSIFPGEKKL